MGWRWRQMVGVDAGGAAAPQCPLWQAPPAQAVPLGTFLHLPCLRFVQGGHRFLAAAPSIEAAPRAPPSAAATARRREPVMAKERARASKRALSIPRSSGLPACGGGGQ